MKLLPIAPRRLPQFAKALAVGLMALAPTLVHGAGSIRVLVDDPGERIADASDDQLRLVPLRWDTSDPAVASGVELVAVRTPFLGGSTTETAEIIPPANNLFGRITSQLAVRQAIIDSMKAWNDVGSDFRYKESLRYNDSVFVLDPTAVGGVSSPVASGLDRVNLISFQDPLVDLGTYTVDGGGVLSQSNVFFFQSGLRLG